MVEINTYPPHVKKFWSNNTGTPVHFLMTQERTQVLDLLVHLITNSTDSIIVCGPEGVGKTDLLKVLQCHQMASSIYCPMEGNKELSLDKIQEQLAKAMKPDKSGRADRPFASIHGDQGTLQKKIVLIIDNAGTLAPGLIKAIIRYADENPYIRVTFVLTHDQLHLKYKSDPVIENCHIVEVSPFSEEQCGKFLQHLSAGAPVNALSDSLIADIYRRTHGTPAGVISEFSGLFQSKRDENPTKILVIAVAGLILVALSVQWLSSRQTITESRILAQTTPNATDINLNQIYLTIPPGEPIDALRNKSLQINVGEALSHGSNPGLDMASAGLDKTSGMMPNPILEQSIENHAKPDMTGHSHLENSGLDENLKQLDKEVAPDEEKTAGTDTAPEDEASVWLSSQPENNYTLQLMVLSKHQSMQEVMKKYPALQKEFRYVRRLIKSKEKFVLLYGTFSDAGLANKTKQALPAEFRKSLTRKISAINTELGLTPTAE